MIGQNYIFRLTDKQYKKLENWYNYNFKDKKFGAMGGGLTFKITPTSIGEIVIAECMGKTISLTEIN